MSLTAIQGAFSTGVGAVGTTIDLTGVPGANFLFCWWNGETNTADAVTAQTARMGRGFANGSDRFCTYAIIINAEPTMDSGSGIANDSVVKILLNPAVVDGVLDIDSWISGGVRLIVDDEFSQSYRVHYILANIPNVALGSFDFPTSGTTINISGLAFQPEAAMFLNSHRVGFGGMGTEFSLGMGFSSGANNDAVIANFSQDNVGDSNTKSYCYFGECTSIVVSAGVMARGKINSWNTDGFTIGINENATSAPRKFVYAAFAGAEFLVGNLLTQTDTTTDINETIGFETKACIIASHNQGQSTQDTTQSTNSLSVGAFVSSTSEGAQAIYDENIAATSSSTTAVEHDSCYINLDINDAVEGLMHCTEVTTTGFTLRMTDADPSQAFCIYLAMGDIAGKSYPFTGKHKTLFEGNFG